MKPKKIIPLVNKAINRWLSCKDNSKFRPILRDMKKLQKGYAKEESDYRSGDETYGYSADSIENTMLYVSDRWRCASRLKWLIDGIENGSI